MHGVSIENLYIRDVCGGHQPKCSCGCGKKTGFISWDEGFRKYVDIQHRETHKRSLKYEIRTCKNEHCSNEFEILKSKPNIYCSRKCSATSKSVKDNRKKTNLKRFGVEYPAQDDTIKSKQIQSQRDTLNSRGDEILKKRKHRMKEKYGVNYPLQSEDVKKKLIKTNLDKYGTEYGFQSDQIKDKIKDTNIVKYGVPHPLMNDEVSEKAKKTMIEKYGVDNISKLDKTKEKKIKNSLDRYGTKHVLQSEQVKEKIVKTNLKRYGVVNPSQSTVIKNKSKETVFRKHFQKIINSQKFLDVVEVLFTEQDYKGIETEYPFLCKRCGQKFESSLTKGRIPRCPTCYPNQNTSKMERDVLYFIQSLGVDVQNNVHPFEGSNMELDIFIPEKKVAIEFNGLYWHGESNGKHKKYHLTKTNVCDDNGIRLIHIFEDEWVSSRYKVENRLRYILGKSMMRKIYARKCVVKEISYDIKSSFIDDNHIQGDTQSSVNLGLFHKDELVSVMTFSNKRVALGGKQDGGWELLRFCSSEIVLGGASKLFSHFIREHDPKEVISYSDLRWNKMRNTLYENLNFDLIGKTDPNYWYFKPSVGVRYHRYNFAKHKLSEKLELFEDSLTEWENMQLNGYDRIWDCGNLKFRWKK